MLYCMQLYQSEGGLAHMPGMPWCCPHAFVWCGLLQAATPKDQYLLLKALNEALVSLSALPPGGTHLEPQYQHQVLALLLATTLAEEECANVVAECLGHLALLAPHAVLPVLQVLALQASLCPATQAEKQLFMARYSMHKQKCCQCCCYCLCWTAAKFWLLRYHILCHCLLPNVHIASCGALKV